MVHREKCQRCMEDENEIAVNSIKQLHEGIKIWIINPLSKWISKNISQIHFAASLWTVFLPTCSSARWFRSKLPTFLLSFSHAARKQRPGMVLWINIELDRWPGHIPYLEIELEHFPDNILQIFHLVGIQSLIYFTPFQIELDIIFSIAEKSSWTR